MTPVGSSTSVADPRADTKINREELGAIRSNSVPSSLYQYATSKTQPECSTMSRRPIITDFFKPYAYPRQSERPPPYGEPEQSRPSRRLRSNTPHATVLEKTEQTNASTAPNDAFLVSSQSSALSFLHDDFPSTPEELSNQTQGNFTVKANNSNPALSFLADPTLSQVPAVSSSQCAIKNGGVVIRDSDEDRSDTDTSLEDIDKLFGPGKHPAESFPDSEDELPPVPSAHATRSRPSNSTVRGQARSTAAIGHESPTPIAIPKYKFSLDALIKQRQKENESRLVVEEAQCLLEGLEEQKSLSTGVGTSALNETLLATVIKDNDDGGNIHRLMAAIARTEAFDQQKTWSVFKDHRDDCNVEPRDCPTVADPFWQSTFDEPVARQQAFLSGYVGECASFRKLPDELLTWLVDAACHETRDDLHQSYCRALQEIGDRVTDLVTTSKFSSLLDCIGATPEALDLQQAAVPIATSPNDPRAPAHARLRRILNVYQAVTASMSMRMRAHTICILSRLLLDREIVNDCTLLSNLMGLISAIIDSTDHDDLNDHMTAALTTIYHSTDDLGLRLQLLRNFPASSSRSALFRRRLALASFFQDETYLSEHHDHLVDFKNIMSHLNRPHFLVNSDTDYPSFAACMAILAIGVDNGDPPREDADIDVQVAFNDDVDILAQRIKAMFTQIVDTGASHMKRTEAKQALESFHACLAYAVRTKQKPKGGSWEDDAGVEKQKSMISGFVQWERFPRDVAIDV